MMVIHFKMSKMRVYILFVVGICALALGFSMYLVHANSSQTIRVRHNSELFGESYYGISQEDSQMQEWREKSFMQKIVYNRVGKCGSRSMMSLMAGLVKSNNYVFYPSPVTNHTRLPLSDLVKEAKIINSLPTPSIYSRHIHYIEFTKFGMIPPVYINMIRDPIERFSSQYHFARFGDNKKAEGRRLAPWKEGQRDMNINDCILKSNPDCDGDKLYYLIPYFCGQDAICQRAGKESLYQAKIHVINNYLVVGYLEDFEGFLQVLQKVLPTFFNGVTDEWNNISEESMNHTSTLKKIEISPSARAVLKEKMKYEFDFYNFVKARFRKMKRDMGILSMENLY